MPHASLAGLLSPVVTPFDKNLAPDRERWLAHCRWLLSQNCGLAIFGTNSEANSLSLAERLSLLEAAGEAGLDGSRMMPGTGACTIPEAVELSRAALAQGSAGVLMLPPFYYKGVPEEGLFRFYAEVIQRVGDAKLKIYLYHIPPVAQVPISLKLIERLLKEFPDTVVGIKDSSGDWANTEAMLKTFDKFDVFCGSETFLLQTMRGGGAGCISATANVNPAAIHDLYANWQADDADARQEKITAFRLDLAKLPMIPALKGVIAEVTGDDAWLTMRPPLVELDAAQRAQVAETLRQHGFEMPGRREAA